MKTIAVTLFSAIAVAQFLQVNGFSTDITKHIFSKLLKILGTSSTQEREPILPQIITAVNPKLTKIYHLKNPIKEEIMTEETPFDFFTTNSDTVQNYSQIQVITDDRSIPILETTVTTPVLEHSTEYSHADTTIPYTEYGILFLSDPIEFRSTNSEVQQQNNQSK